MSDKKVKKTQEAMGRVHATLDEKDVQIFEGIVEKVSDITLGGLIATAVMACLPVFEERLPKGKPFKVEGTQVNPTVLEGDFQVRKLHVYFGSLRELIERMNKLAEKGSRLNRQVTASWIMRQACRICAPLFHKHVPKGKPFKVAGVKITR